MEARELYHKTLCRRQVQKCIYSWVRKKQQKDRWVYKKGSFHVFCFFFSKSCKVLFVLSFVCLQHCTDFFFFFLVFFFCLFVLAVTEHKGPAVPLHTDTSIVYREKEGPHQTWPTPIASCLDPQRGRLHSSNSSRMDWSVKSVHLYINNIFLCNCFLFVSGSRRCSWKLFFVLFFFYFGEFPSTKWKEETQVTIFQVYDCSFLWCPTLLFIGILIPN